jgi:exopolysaccharide biosynthesis polyprenyl glycosylphosphotransferase
MKSTGDTHAVGNEISSAFLPKAAYIAHHREKIQKRGKGLVSWIVGIGFVGDTLAIVGGLLLAFWVRFHTPVRELGRTASQMHLDQYRGHLIFLSVTLLLVLFYMGLYGSRHTLRLRRVNAIILGGCFLWFLGNLGLSFELNTQPIVSRVFLLCAFACTAGTLMFWRSLFDASLTIPPIAAALQRRILFVGWSENSAKLVDHIVNDPKHPYRIVGCVPSIHGSYDLPPPHWVRQLGEYADLKDLLSEQVIDIAIVADLNPTSGELLDMVTLCEKEIVHLQIIPSCFQILLSGLHLETTSGVPVLGISKLPLDSPWNQILKRTIDIIGSLVGLVLSAPLIAIFGAIVYYESPGPIFYRQRRLGREGQEFFIVKIRSMRLDSERDGKPGWTRRDDPRRLKIGAKMRAWNVDEVPQFWNVLKGEMSLVGPRPERPELIDNFKEEIPHYNARHGIKPGITGWAQVNGLRGDTDLIERIKCDLYYIENWNLFLELQIILMTFFNRTNAC